MTDARTIESCVTELKSVLLSQATTREEVRKANARLIDAIHDARASGMTLQAIGDVLGLTRQRVKQMLDKETS